MPIERKLAAIMFTDIAGYTAQMSKDEAVAISLLNKKESVLKPLIAKHNGTYVKSTGDGSLSHFNSAVDAATCAKRFQESIYDDKDLNVRVGVHLGDTIFEKGDIRGDGVNIASRLESMAVAGGVFVSKEVHDQLANQKEFEGVSLGLQSMKGVGRLIEVYGLKGDLLTEPKPSDYQDNKVVVHSDDEVPSIAIIPLKNKGDDKDIFYAYGISADLISDCSGAGLIRVESLDNIEKLENYGKLNAHELASKLFVRYIATGTLWKMNNVFQLSIELYDTKNKKVVWSDRWQEKWANLSTIKGDLSDGLLQALNTQQRVKEKVEITNSAAYEFYLEGLYIYKHWSNTEDINKAIKLLNKSIENDKYLVNAYKLLGWINYRKADYEKASKFYKEYNRISTNNNLNIHIAWSYLYLGDISNATDNGANSELYYLQALEIFKKENHQRGMAGIYYNLGLNYYYSCNYDKGMNYFNKSKEIEEKIEQKNSQIYSVLAGLYSQCGDVDNAEKYINKALTLCEENNNTDQYFIALVNAIDFYELKKDYKKVISTAEEMINISNMQSRETSIGHYISINLSKKKLNIDFDNKEFFTILNKKTIKNLDYGLTYKLYLLIEDNKYLELSYNNLIGKANKLSSDIKAKFLSYPIPAAIVEEWEKVK